MAGAITTKAASDAASAQADRAHHKIRQQHTKFKNDNIYVSWSALPSVIVALH